MNSIFDIINVPLGYLFKGIYFLVNNYGVTIILFTIAIKLLLLPLNIKQQRSMKKMAALQPKLAKIQEKYAQDKEKQSQETMKLYQESGVNPMGGCLPMLLQFPILIALYNIIRKPLSYVVLLGKDKNILATIAERLSMNAKDVNFEINAAKKLGENFDSVKDIIVSRDSLINFDFLGFDLSIVPSLDWISQHLEYALIPLLAGGTTYLVSVISNKISGTNPNSDAANSMKMMNVIFPVMTAWFAITLPAGLGLYWTVSNVFQIAQLFLLNKMLKVDTSFAEIDELHFRERKKKKK